VILIILRKRVLAPHTRKTMEAAKKIFNEFGGI
jgi:hypothetical protein